MVETGKAGVLFDIDGTLLDSTYHHTLAWLRAFRDHGYNEITSAQVHRAIGLGDDHLVPHLLGHEQAELADAHSKHYAALRDEVQALPRAAELITRCAAADLRVVLATSGKANDLDWMLPRIGSQEGIMGWATSEDVEKSKPAPDILQCAAKQHGLGAGNAVTVGDSVWDGKAARAANIRFVALLSGGVAEAELREAGAVEVYQGPADLLAHFDESLLATL